MCVSIIKWLTQIFYFWFHLSFVAILESGFHYLMKDSHTQVQKEGNSWLYYLSDCVRSELKLCSSDSIFHVLTTHGFSSGSHGLEERR